MIWVGLSTKSTVMCNLLQPTLLLDYFCGHEQTPVIFPAPWLLVVGSWPKVIGGFRNRGIGYSDRLVFVFFNSSAGEGFADWMYSLILLCQLLAVDSVCLEKGKRFSVCSFPAGEFSDL